MCPRKARFTAFWLLAWTGLGPATLLPTVASAQTGTSTPTVDVEALKDELRRDLRRELKEELKAELREELAQDPEVLAPVEQDDWAETDWEWEEPAEPQLNFLELHGYFRTRWDLFWQLDLDTFRVGAGDVPYGPYAEPVIFRGLTSPDVNGQGEAPPVPVCATDVGDGGCANEDDVGQTLAGANVRLRLEPTLNVYEDIKIHSQIDVLDNVILGSTPNSLPFNPFAPVSVLSNTAIPPSDGINAVWQDSLRVKRLWGEVTLPFGLLRFGRQPDHFGMGILANDGSGLDADFGDNVDRIQFAVKLADFYIMPSYDWLATGPTSAIRYDPIGQPFDRGERDDADQWTLQVTKTDSEEVIQQKLHNDKIVWHAGLRTSYRRQSADAANFFREGDVEGQASASELVFRDAELFTGAAWAKLQWRKLTVEAEFALLAGSFENQVQFRNQGEDFDPGVDDRDQLDILQQGVAIRGEYKLLKDKLRLQLLVAAASGDRAPGWGVRPLTGTAEAVGRPGSVWDGNQGLDGDLRNFRFNPAFVFDMILWRQLIGTLTDGLVIRPSVQYNFSKEFGARLDIVYSRAIFSESTPSASFDSFGDNELTDAGLRSRSADANLGLEFDTKLFYNSDNGFHFWLEQGFFIPFDGLDRAIPVEDGLPVSGVDGVTNAQILNAEFAYTLQLMFGITF